MQTHTGEPLLQATKLSAGYHGHPVIHDIDIAIHDGEVTALIGPNGAGKSTTLKSLAGDIQPISGEITLLGQVTRKPLHQRASRGIAYVSEERSIFPALSTADNLKVARCDPTRALDVFPELKPLMRRRAGLLSGGEQQMLTLGRAIARQPRVLIADELSLGLAPLLVIRLLDAVRAAAHDHAVGVLLVEQHVRQALRYSDHVLVMNRGQIVLRGPQHEMADKLAEIEASYFATSVDDD